MKNKVMIAILVIMLTACRIPIRPIPTVNAVTSNTPLASAFTQAAILTITPIPSDIPTSTPTFFMDPPTPLPITPVTPTVVSPYEADHRAIRKVIDRYFDKLYSTYNTYQVDGFDNTVSTSPEAVGFLQTELRRRAVYINFARRNFLRYASYSYSLDYSEIVVYDSGQRARANFTEGNAIIYELSIPSGILSQTSGVKHIVILLNDKDGWRIIYDVHDQEGNKGSLYDPTPLPAGVIQGFDKQLIDLSKGQGGPALPTAGKLFVPSDPAQLDRWPEYETALAAKLMPQYPRDKVQCEWELSEKLEHKLNVWAFCMTSVTSPNLGSYYFPAASVPAVIHLAADGAVESVEIPGYGNGYVGDFNALFPNRVWKDLPNVSAMESHLHWRRTNRAEPPLVVLNATAILKVTPIATPAP